MTHPIPALIDRWRAEVARLRERYADETRAQILAVAAEELEEALDLERKAVVSLGEAALYSGYSKSHLRSLLRDGTLTQAGRKGKPALYRYELPVKPGYEPVHPENVRALRRRKARKRR